MGAGRNGHGPAVRHQRFRTKDGRLFLHAGIIHAGAGERREASRWLQKADRLRSMLLPSERTLLARQLNDHPHSN